MQMPHPRDISVVQKNVNSPPKKELLKHQKVVNKRLQSKNFKVQRLFKIKMSPDLYKIMTTP